MSTFESGSLTVLEGEQLARKSEGGSINHFSCRAFDIVFDGYPYSQEYQWQRFRLEVGFVGTFESYHELMVEPLDNTICGRVVSVVRCQ